MKEVSATMNQLLHLVVPAKAEYLSLVRLVVASVANQSGFSEESVADIKVALSEASTNVVRHAYAVSCPPSQMTIEINCYEDRDNFVIEVQDHGCGIPLPPPASEGLGLGIMSSLMDNVVVEAGHTGTTVLLEKSPAIPRR
ncbi:MAG: anti-sigma regulatory factor [Thermoleophilia bacterium]|nr:anti-sigma regulatory factor [Thermoleophilia bacterium]